jgi:glycosyltransferase involved in cell wall biosynthesis
VLIVAYYFPPLGGIGSIRAMKFASYLPEWGWQATVLAPFTRAHPHDPSLLYPEGNVVRTKALELSRVGKAMVGIGPRSKAAPTAGVRGVLRRFAHRALYYPDAQIGWYPYAVAAGRALLRDQRFDAIFSSSFPITAHLIARRLQRDTGIPWVAEFRDPWADVQAGARAGDRRDRLERAILREADAVVTVSPSWQEHFRAKGARRVEVVTNGFDPGDQAPPASAPDYVVTHLGSFYPEMQDLRTVWMALQRMRELEPALPLRIRFVGELGAEVLNRLRSFGLSDVVETSGFLAYRDALAAAAKSTVLVVAGVDPARPLHRGVIPAKIFEYLATGLPILYVGQRTTDAARLLQEHAGCHVVEPGDVDGAIKALSSAGGGRVDRELGGFTRHALAGQLARVLERVGVDQSAGRSGSSSR